jgi:hypothetical protein
LSQWYFRSMLKLSACSVFHKGGPDGSPIGYSRSPSGNLLLCLFT